MQEYKRYTKEQIMQANNVDIAQFVISHGIAYEKAGKDLRIKGYGGLCVDPQTNLFDIFSKTKADGSYDGGKGALAFCQKGLGMSFKEAMRTLVGEASTIPFSKQQYEDKPKEKIEFICPEKSADQKKVYAYLIKQRMLSYETVGEFIKKGILYQGITEYKKNDGTVSRNENAVFLHRNENGEPCGADIQGILSGTRFKGILPHDDSDRGFVYNKGDISKADTVYLFEAPIDLMSYVELHPEIENAQFVAMGGLKPTIAEHYIDSGKSVVSCVDNDKAGEEFNRYILMDKMQECLSLQGGSDLECLSCKDREPPIKYLNADVNGRKISFFMSREDYRECRDSGAKIESSACVWINRSNFTVNRECAEAGVKDFNDLLKAVKSDERTVCNEKFIARTREIADWSRQTQTVIQEKYSCREQVQR